MKQVLRKWLFFLGCIALALILCILSVVAQRKRAALPAAGWVQSQSAVIQLGAFQKYGDYSDRAYDALFIVTDSAGKQATARKHSSGGETVYVLFPEDFEKTDAIHYPEYSTYSWKCIVGDQTVAGGQFQWGNFRANAP